jgi:hypothetical protein
MDCDKCKSKESDKKSLKNILEEGAQWQNDLSMIIIDLCLKIEKLEKINKLD